MLCSDNKSESNQQSQVLCKYGFKCPLVYTTLSAGEFLTENKLREGESCSESRSRVKLKANFGSRFCFFF